MCFHNTKSCCKYNLMACIKIIRYKEFSKREGRSACLCTMKNLNIFLQITMQSCQLYWIGQFGQFTV